MAGMEYYRDGAEVPVPESIQMFSRLCLVAGLYNVGSLFVFALLRPLPHPAPADVADPAVFHIVVALIAALIFLPMLMLPYWLALAFVYSRNQLTLVLLYIGAAVMILMALAMAVRSSTGFFTLLGACLPGVAALICLQQREARGFLRNTVPAFVVRRRGY